MATAIPYLRLSAAATASAGLYAVWRYRTDSKMLLRQHTSHDGATVTVCDDSRGRRMLRLGKACQGVALTDGAGGVMLRHAEEWTQLIAAYADGWLALRSAECEEPPKPPSALFLGLGAAIVPRTLLALHPRLEVHCVELYAEVIEAAHHYFGLPRHHPRCQTTTQDATEFLATTHSAKSSDQRAQGCPQRRTYDIVVMDCFSESGSNLADEKLLGELAPWVGERGLLLINTTWGIDATDRAATATKLADCLQSDPTGHRMEVQYLVEARGCRNVLVLSHRGAALDDDAWRRVLAASMARMAARDCCPFVAADAMANRHCLPRRHDVSVLVG